MSRIARLAERLEQPLLVTTGVNVTYLTGFRSSNCALLVDPDGSATLYTDFRYLESARAIEGVEVVQTARAVAGDLGGLLAGRRVGFEAGTISYAHWRAVGSGGADLVPVTGAVEALRAVKDDAELDAIRRACAVTDRVYEALAQERIVGRTEAEVAWWLERTFRELGADEKSFSFIVASGENGAKPHAGASGAVIPEGTLVTVDMGCIVDGYCSDSTRTFATGDLPSQLAEAYALVQQAQLDGVAAIRAGVTGRDADAASRVVIAEAGLGDMYGHGLGHGVGMEVHEAPALRPESPDTLAARNVVSAEPGLYLPGVGGCRIEDLVVVRNDGCEILTHFTKDLVTLG